MAWAGTARARRTTVPVHQVAVEPAPHPPYPQFAFFMWADRLSVVDPVVRPPLSAGHRSVPGHATATRIPSPHGRGPMILPTVCPLRGFALARPNVEACRVPARRVLTSVTQTLSEPVMRCRHRQVATTTT